MVKVVSPVDPNTAYICENMEEAQIYLKLFEKYGIKLVIVEQN